MKLRVLVLINALVVALTLAILNYYFQNSLYHLAVTFVLTLVICYGVFYLYATSHDRFLHSQVIALQKLPFCQ